MGGLSHAEEKQLHDTDYPAWCQYIAPRWIEIGRKHPERKAEMWACASAQLKQTIRELVRAES